MSDLQDQEADSSPHPPTAVRHTRNTVHKKAILVSLFLQSRLWYFAYSVSCKFISEQNYKINCLKPFHAHCCHKGTDKKHPVPDRVKPSCVIFDIRALTLSHEHHNARMSEITNDGLTWSGTECLTAVTVQYPYSNGVCQRVKRCFTNSSFDWLLAWLINPLLHGVLNISQKKFLTD